MYRPLHFSYTSLSTYKLDISQNDECVVPRLMNGWCLSIIVKLSVETFAFLISTIEYFFPVLNASSSKPSHYSRIWMWCMDVVQNVRIFIVNYDIHTYVHMIVLYLCMSYVLAIPWPATCDFHLNNTLLIYIAITLKCIYLDVIVDAPYVFANLFELNPSRRKSLKFRNRNQK